MSTRQELIPVTLANGSKIRVAATMLGGEEDVAFKLLSFDEVTNTIEGIAGSLNAALQKVKPKKASVEFGLEVAVESGALTTLLVKGAGTATLKITLEWGN
ncbi:MAG: CU044_2847 family protein [Candidatus Competibacteraceae bacterium]|nr:CU044_2847 family protein [Candidatus Competibacteraceae bacterium]